MSGLVARQQGGLPAKPDDLAKFIVVAQEKLKSVKAEIRAIQRLDLAKEVYNQKAREQARLQEVTLLAYQRMGELTQEMPTSAGGRPSAKKSPSDGSNFKKTKAQAIQDLGLSTSQVGRMEQIAAHPDIVEEVIAESQVGQTEATQAEVLRRIKRLNDIHDADTEEGHQDDANLRLFRRATGYRDLCKITDEVLNAVVDNSGTLCIDLDRLSNLTFQAWAQKWYEGYKDSVSPTTYESYGYTLKTLVKGFGPRKLSSIKALDVENFLKGLRADGKSDSYLTKCRGILYQIMHKAEANDLIRKNPVRFAEKMKAQRPVKRKEAFTQEEVQRLMEDLPQDKTGHTIRLMLATGMRTQEVLALEPRHIEPDGSCIHIRQAVNMVKGKPHIGPPKTATSVRDVPVPPNVRPCAVFLREQAGKFVWESPIAGQPVNPSHFRDKYRNALFKVPGVRMLTPHSCRHTYVSQLQALGVDMETIQSMVGHADIEMTQHYLHVQEEVRQAAAEKFSKTFKVSRSR